MVTFQAADLCWERRLRLRGGSQENSTQLLCVTSLCSKLWKMLIDVKLLWLEHGIDIISYTFLHVYEIVLTSKSRLRKSMKSKPSDFSGPIRSAVLVTCAISSGLF